MSTVVLIDVQKQGRSVIIRSARKSFKADSNGPSHMKRLIKKIYLNLPFSAINDLLVVVLFFKPETIRLGVLDKRR